MFRMYFGPVLLAAAPVAANQIKTPDQPNKQALFRPQELPIYISIFEKHDDAQPMTSEPSIVRSSIEGGVKVVRESCCDCVQLVKDKKTPIDEFIATGIGHSQFAIDYLNEPANGVHRVGAIAIGAVSGYIIAIRRGFFRRLLYTSIGGLGVASICYPKDAEHYWQHAISESKTYATILYNFAYGVKPGDEPKPLPSLKTTYLDDTYRTIKSYIVSDKK